MGRRSTVKPECSALFSGTRTAPALGRNRPELDAEHMPRLLKVLERVPIPADATELLPPAVDQAAGEAEPEVRGERAGGAGGGD